MLEVGLQKGMGHGIYSSYLWGKKYVLRHEMITVSKYYLGIPGNIFEQTCHLITL